MTSINSLSPPPLFFKFNYFLYVLKHIWYFQDVSAKDGSQETAVSLLGLLFGLLLTPFLNSQKFIWGLFLFFTCLHLFANYKAVSCIVFSTFNRQRASISITHYCSSLLSPSALKVLSPKEVSQMESVLPIPSWSPITLGGKLSDLQLDNFKKLGKNWIYYCLISSSFHSLVQNIYSEEISKLFKNENYFLFVKESSEIIVILRKSATPIDILKSYFHAEVKKKKLLLLE